MIPLSSCNQAASILIQALGGEQKATEITGGTRWWQVRGLKGIDANWIAVKKDWESAKVEREKRKQSTSEKTNPDVGDESEYTSEMDPMRCVHGLHQLCEFK